MVGDMDAIIDWATFLGSSSFLHDIEDKIIKLKVRKGIVHCKEGEHEFIPNVFVSRSLKVLEGDRRIVVDILA